MLVININQVTLIRTNLFEQNFYILMKNCICNFKKVFGKCSRAKRDASSYLKGRVKESSPINKKKQFITITKKQFQKSFNINNITNCEFQILYAYTARNRNLKL